MCFIKSYLQLIAIAICITTLTSCMVGPDYHPSKPPNTNSYTKRSLPKKTVSTPAAGKAGKSQQFVAGKDIPAEWWFLFHSQPLNNLIITGISNSPNLAAAKAALRQAQETVNAQIGASFYPNVSAQLGGEREKFNSATFGGGFPSTIFNIYNAQVNVSYTLDFFGGMRREVEALCAQVDYQKYEVEAAYLTLTSNIVTTAITVASIRAQIQATHYLIRSQANLLTLIEKQFRLGGVSKANVLSQQTELAQTKATLPPLEQSLAQNYHALAVLVGSLPSQSNLSEFDLNKLTLPTKLPISVPSLLVRQRPDIRASEALLHAASAQVGVATANLYPQITLTGSYGWESGTISHMLSPKNIAWNYGTTLMQTIFAGGSLQAKKRAAIAAYDQTAAQYRQTVLQAFQNVADSLRALENDAKELQDQKQAEIASRDSLRLTEKQFRLGGVSYLSLLTAEQQYQQARINRIKAQAARYTDTAALFQALGGGWWNRGKV